MWYHTATAAIAVNTPAPAGTLSCADVHGRIDARVSAIRPALVGLRLSGRGQSHGDLAGPLEVAVLKPFNSDPLTVEFEIVTAAGTALASGRATVVGDDEQRQIASQLVVRGGTGAFTNATGRLRARGSVRTRERTLHVQYDGLICAPANELTQTRERRQNALAVAS